MIDRFKDVDWLLISDSNMDVPSNFWGCVSFFFDKINKIILDQFIYFFYFGDSNLIFIFWLGCRKIFLQVWKIYNLILVFWLLTIFL